MKTLFILALTVAVLTTWSADRALAQSSQYHQVPGAYSAMDITPDGEVIVSFGDTGGGYYWRWREDPAPVSIGGKWVYACNDDATVIVGEIEFPPGSGSSVSALWSPANGWEPLCSLSLCNGQDDWYTLSDISGDGNSGVGLFFGGAQAFGFYWSRTGGIRILDELGNGTNRASTISRDGLKIGGFAQGNFTRTPAVWTPDGLGSVFDMDTAGEVVGMSNNGAIALGDSDGGAFAGSPISGLLPLGSLNGGNWNGRAVAITAAQTRIVGYDFLQLAKQSWIWNAGGAVTDLRTSAMNDYGIPSVPELHQVTGMSEDGRVIVGRNDFGGGWILELYENDAVITNLGGGINGANGTPQLTLAGALTGGSSINMDVTQAPSGAPMLLWISFASSPVHYFSGTIHALPQLIEIFLPANGAGELHLPTTWPAGVPVGTDMWFQFLVGDPSKPWGITLTNGIRATTPS